MDKTPQKVTKEPKRVEAARKGRENYMNKLKESILNESEKGSGDTSNASNETTGTTNTAITPANSTNNTATTRSSDTYVYGIGILAVLAIAVCVFFTYNASKAAENKSMKNRINHQNNVICFTKIYNKLVALSIHNHQKTNALKAANVKLLKASLDAIDIIKLAGEICGKVLVKDYAVYKKWINE